MIFNKLEVLLVSNDKDVTELTNSTIIYENYKFVASNSLLNIEKILHENIFDVLLFDIDLLKSTQLNYFKELRLLLKNVQIPIILLIDSVHEQLLIDFLNNGVDDYIHKPVNIELLNLKINSNLRYNISSANINSGNFQHILSSENGKILFFSNTQIGEIEGIDIIITNSIIDYNNILKTNNVWIVVLTEAFFYNNTKPSFEDDIFYLFYGNVENLNSYIIDNIDFICNNKSEAYLKEILISFFKREVKLKSKYISAFNLVAEKTTLNYDRYFDDSNNNLNISILYEPYRKLPGGDFYEIFTISNDTKLIFFGDIMGKSWDAWFYVPVYIAYIRSLINFLNLTSGKYKIEPQELTTTLNGYICKDFRFSDVFTTLNVILLNSNTGKVKYSSAGAIAPFYFDSENDEVLELDAKGLLIGINPDFEYSQKEIVFNKNDKLLFYTDGYSEAGVLLDNYTIDRKSLYEVFFTLRNKQNLSSLEIEDFFIEKYNINKFEDDRTLMLITMI